jgi:hypothetical protein
MPIAASMPLINSAVSSALNLGQAATNDLTASIIMAALSSAVPMGMFPVAPVPIPLVPGGASACKTMITQALGLGKAATADLTAQMIAAGISILAPTAPPAGLSALQSQIKSALSMSNAATPSAVAAMIAIAVVAYYSSGGVM